MGTDKALLPWPPVQPGRSGNSGQTLLSAAIETLNQFADMVIVVAGTNEAALSAVVYPTGGELVRNSQPDRGQFSSLQVGLQEVLNRGRDAAIVTLVERPPVRASTLQDLMTTFGQAVSQKKWAVIPDYEGKHGHPILMGREMIEAYLRAPARTAALAVENENREHIEYMPVTDPWVTANINTPEDYAALRVVR